jgi:hypothetical protein
MKKYIAHLSLTLGLLFLQGEAFGQVQPRAATQSEVNAGILRSKFVSPQTLAGWPGTGLTGVVSLVTVTNIAAYQALIATNSLVRTNETRALNFTNAANVFAGDGSGLTGLSESWKTLADSQIVMTTVSNIHELKFIGTTNSAGQRTNYLIGVCRTTPAALIRANPRDLSQYDVVRFPTGQNSAADFVFTTNNSEPVILLPVCSTTSSNTLIYSININTLATNLVVNASDIEEFDALYSCATDHTNLYVTTLGNNSSWLHKYSLADWTRTSTNFYGAFGANSASQPHSIRWDNTNLFITGYYEDPTWIIKATPEFGMTYLDLGAAVAPYISDDMALLGGYVYFDVEGLSDNRVVRVSKALDEVAIIYNAHTASLVGYGTVTDGTYIWHAGAGGASLLSRINPTTLEVLQFPAQFSGVNEITFGNNSDTGSAVTSELKDYVFVSYFASPARIARFSPRTMTAINHFHSSTNNAEITVLDGVVYGNGSGLTNLDGANIQAGTINSNSIEPDTWLACTNDAGGGGGITLTDATNAALGVIAASNSYNGTFTGDGSALTNFPVTSYTTLITVSTGTNALYVTSTNTHECLAKSWGYYFWCESPGVYYNGGLCTGTNVVYEVTTNFYRARLGEPISEDYTNSTLTGTYICEDVSDCSGATPGVSQITVQGYSYGGLDTLNLTNNLSISGTNTAGYFVGNGSGLTNIPLSGLRQMPLTNNQAGAVTFGGVLTLPGMILPVKITDTNYTSTVADYYVQMTAADITNTIPNAALYAGRTYVVDNADSENITNYIVSAGGLIDGSADPQSINFTDGNFETSVTFISDGTNWRVLAR